MRITGTWTDRAVTLDGKPLSAKRSQQIWNHSPDGFCWGYAGSGPAQLALAILLAAGAKRDTAVRHHQAFKFEVITLLPQDDFAIDVDVTAWLANRDDGENQDRDWWLANRDGGENQDRD
jgi:Family of unknown function (DUF6166)